VRAALVPLALGLAAYPFVAARFDLRELAAGHGDQWVAGGALAIAGVACAEIGAAARPLHALGPIRPALDDVALAIWAAAMILLPVLVAGEALRPWRGYHVRRWATVFPVGMYAVCSFLVAGLDDVGAIGDFARVWIWVAFGVWVIACAGLAGRGLAALAHYDLRR
jgi:tellurite resistance protein TehA-like permease